ncbi:DUF2852 domain-containing protein [Fertoebacter nigrum]|uniref:DUF2852 domain-containing protein n=1 Tax=Fertoeibacter niger TaxID=2656921 RepID=A0A8X8GYW6_9RHOB|nr:DUF2852 domain-containing protein [Fertoeibacter niger]NUB43022.1 DUF2852 domain-containing protein [Fertoeibacter niger]
MNTASSSAFAGGITSWLTRAEAWLDNKGRWAWITAMVLGFVFVWPVGLALLAYMIWSKRMFKRTACTARRDGHMGYRSHGTSGNTAFDAYKADMLRRLEDEQTAFEAFLQRLRDAKDKSEFDAFMDDRARAGSEARNTPPAAPVDEAPRAGNY